MKRNLRALPKFRDGISFLYVERSIIDRKHQSLSIVNKNGRAETPCAGINTLLLGPGTQISHAAVGALADAGCMVFWVGEDGLKFYASGSGKSHSTANLQKQVEVYSQPGQRLQVVRSLYALRFDEQIAEGKTLQQIRGMEGARVRDAYRAAAEEYGVEWRGRSYRSDSWAEADPINKALSVSNALLYAVCQSAIEAVGLSPALGFIHTGKRISFVYDIADVFKTEISLPVAFQVAVEGERDVEKRTRALMREKLKSERILQRCVLTLGRLFDLREGDDVRIVNASGELWDPDGSVPAGIVHDSTSGE